MLLRFTLFARWRNPSAAQPRERVSQNVTLDAGAGTGDIPPSGEASSPVPAGAQAPAQSADPLKTYAEALTAFRGNPYGYGKRAALMSALHDRLKAELGR